LNLDDAVRRIETEFVSSDGPAGSTGPQGYDYAIVCSGGIKAEGQQLPALYRSPVLAVAAWLAAVRQYAAHVDKVDLLRVPGRGAATKRRLYWRHRPELEQVRGVELKNISPSTDWWVVYSRLVILPRRG
jgi:hypothetical protein